jgi:hypothetical protein
MGGPLSRSPWRWVILAAAICLYAAPAYAKAEPDEREVAAVTLVKEAIALQRSGDHEAAVRLLEEAWTIDAHPKILFFKARSLMVLERWSEAHELYVMIRKNVRDLEQGKLDEVERNMALSARLAEQSKETLVSIEAPRVPGAMVSLNGKPIGEAPRETRLKRGHYEIRIEHPEHHPFEQALEVSGQDRLAVTAALRPRVEAPFAPLDAPSSGRRTWGWIAAGSGAAVTAAGLGFLGNYLVQSSKDLEPNQRMRDAGLDQAIGGTLSAVGVGLVVTGVILLVTGDDPPAAAPSTPEVGLAPISGGAFLGVRGAL